MPRKLWVLFVFLAVLSCSPEDEETLLLREPQNNTIQAANSDPVLIIPFDDNCSEATFDLIAGRKEVAGKVNITNNDTDLIITYTLNEDWYMLAAKIYAGPFADVPLSKGGNPKIGHFPYKFIFFKPRTEFTLHIPLESLKLDDSFCLSVATFAELFTALPEPEDDEKDLYENGEKDNKDNNKDERGPFISNLGDNERQIFYKKYRFESAWAGDKDFEGASIARYFEFCPTDCKQFTNLPCETSYMLGDFSFIDLGLTDTRWGWAQEVNQVSAFKKPMYARALLNNLNRGFITADVEVNVVNNKVNVKFTARPGFSFSKTDVYLSDEQPEVYNPASLPFRNRHNNVADFQYELEYSGDGDFWIIAHAETCSER